MSEKTIEDLSADEFENIMQEFIEHPITEMPVSSFMTLLGEIEQTKGDVVHVRAQIENGKLHVEKP